MMLAASQGSIITIRCNGNDQDDAMRALCELINNYFEEEE